MGRPSWHTQLGHKSTTAGLVLLAAQAHDLAITPGRTHKILHAVANPKPPTNSPHSHDHISTRTPQPWQPQEGLLHEHRHPLALHIRQPHIKQPRIGGPPPLQPDEQGISTSLERCRGTPTAQAVTRVPSRVIPCSSQPLLQGRYKVGIAQWPQPT
jgi:hypothetical protein